MYRLGNELNPDHLLQLHLELHTLGILEGCLDHNLCSELDEVSEYKFNRLKEQFPPPPNRPNLPTEIKKAETGKRFYKANAWENYHRALKKWHLAPIIKRLRKNEKEMLRLKTTIRDQGESRLLTEDLEYNRLLGQTIEAWCLNEYREVPIIQLKKSGIRRIDQYPHLQKHKLSFPDLANELIKKGIIERSRIYPNGKKPGVEAEADYLFQAFKRAVYRHENHMRGKASIAMRQMPSDNSDKPKIFLVYEKKS